MTVCIQIDEFWSRNDGFCSKNDDVKRRPGFCYNYYDAPRLEADGFCSKLQMTPTVVGLSLFGVSLPFIGLASICVSDEDCVKTSIYTSIGAIFPSKRLIFLLKRLIFLSKRLIFLLKRLIFLLKRLIFLLMTIFASDDRQVRFQ